MRIMHSILSHCSQLGLRTNERMIKVQTKPMQRAYTDAHVRGYTTHTKTSSVFIYRALSK